MDDLQLRDEDYQNAPDVAGRAAPYLRTVLQEVRRVRTPDMRLRQSVIDVNIPAFCAEMVRGTPSEAMSYVGRLCQRGLTVERLFESVFARASVELGDQWSQDDISFAEMTLAYTNLQLVLHHYRADYVGSPPVIPKARLLFATLPKETHLFGLLLLCARLEKQGYATHALGAAAPAMIVERLNSGTFDAVGLSCGGRVAIDHLNDTLDVLANANVKIPILVGGMLAACHKAEEAAHKVDLWSSNLDELSHFLDKNVVLRFQDT
jgi:methanogenic corrinoid protein MtbC1